MHGAREREHTHIPTRVSRSRSLREDQRRRQPPNPCRPPTAYNRTVIDAVLNIPIPEAGPAECPPRKPGPARLHNWADLGHFLPGTNPWPHGGCIKPHPGKELDHMIASEPLAFRPCPLPPCQPQPHPGLLHRGNRQRPTIQGQREKGWSLEG